MPSTAPSDLNVGDTVRYVGPGTQPLTGRIRERLRQIDADDLFVVDWKGAEDDHELYHPCRLLRVGPGRRSALELLRVELEAFKDTAAVLLADAQPYDRRKSLDLLHELDHLAGDLYDSLSLSQDDAGDLVTPEERAAR